METIATQVQNKLSANLISVNINQSESDSLKEQKETSDFIRKIGGLHVSNIMQNEEMLAHQQLKAAIQELQFDPRWKIITYGVLMNILKEHNLVLGPLNRYQKEIPLANAKVMMEYAKTERSPLTFDSVLTPILSYRTAQCWNSESVQRKFYVCADADNFIKENRKQIGQELAYSEHFGEVKFEFVKPNPDPIIVSPLIFHFNHQRFVLIDVVTAWDREAGLIVNEVNN